MDDLTPMMRQYHEVKRQFPGKLVFFRLGDFYEMFYQDAIVASRELEITLTSRNKDKSGAPIPMCGVPFHSVDGYIARLLKKGFKVALCEQVDDPRSQKKLVHREVTRVLTPGTVVEELLLEPKDHNYLAALGVGPEGIGIAFMDLSTSDFLATEFRGESAWTKIIDELSRFRPREILLQTSRDDELQPEIRREWSDAWVSSPVEDWVFNLDHAQRLLMENLGVETLAGYGFEDRSLAVSAAGALVYYLQETQLQKIGQTVTLRYFEPNDFLRLDAPSVKNLELVEDLEGRRSGSLLSVLDRTHTGMGARRIKSWLLAPLLDLTELEQRHDAVEALSVKVKARDRLRRQLANVSDLERLVSRILVGSAGPRDLLALRESAMQLPELKKGLTLVPAPRLQQIATQLDDLADLRQQIESTLADDPPASASNPGVIREGYSAELDSLRAMRGSGREYIASLEARERKRTGIASLKVKFNQIFGYFIEVTKSNLSHIPDDYTRKQTLVNSERFVTEELQIYEEKVLSAEEHISVLEKELFFDFLSAIASHAERIQTVARLIGETDVLASLAEVAVQNNYTRPQVSEGDEIFIEQGRHPFVEFQAQPFIPNDLHLNATTDQMIILTGPNMGGKSTFLRQTALIVILSQMGSFVPATAARIGLVDRIYTRVGASDNLARGRSTFMVEMIETANILNTATNRSLVLLDEVGRGTATFDGLSIAWAVAEYLLGNAASRARTLFATHYHELTKMADVHPGVKNYCMATEDSGNSVVFLRKVIPGTANKSYGIEVARLAGLPREVLHRANQILKRLEKKDIDLTGRPRTRSAEEVFEEIQGSLF